MIHKHTKQLLLDKSGKIRVLRHFTYRIAGNFRGRKLSRISRFSRHPRKFSPRNSRHATPIMRPVLTFRESFLREMLLSYRSAKVFSLENFPLYGILCKSKISTFNFINTTTYTCRSYVSTNNHHLIGRKDCNKRAMSSSWHVADETPGVSCWVVLVNGR